MEHIGLGAPWGLDRKRGGLAILQPHRARRGLAGWYKGTADAVYQNLDFLKERPAEAVLILAGDHIYKMRYNEMVAFHRATGADVTIGVVEVPWEEAPRLGTLVLNEGGRVMEFQEKAPHPVSRLASMGIYVFSSQVLNDVLEEDAHTKASTHDFGRDILPAMIESYAVYGYRFHGYWRDVGTIEAYWKANMEFLEGAPPFELSGGEEGILTHHQDRPPATVGPEATVRLSLLSSGCRILGTVRRSVLSPGVVVEEGAVVEDSIVFDDAVIKQGAVIHYSVVDKEVVVGEGARVGYGDDSSSSNGDEPEHLSCGITLVGKRAVVPPGVYIGRNCKIMPEVTAEDFPPGTLVPSGSTVEHRTRRLALAGVLGSN
jgi:glucose-1-phosphate adenylyltransferase